MWKLKIYSGQFNFHWSNSRLNIVFKLILSWFSLNFLASSVLNFGYYLFTEADWSFLYQANDGRKVGKVRQSPVMSSSVQCHSDMTNIDGDRLADPGLLCLFASRLFFIWCLHVVSRMWLLPLWTQPRMKGSFSGSCLFFTGQFIFWCRGNRISGRCARH